MKLGSPRFASAAALLLFGAGRRLATFSSRGITCILLKYRVPGSGPWWDKQNHRRIYPKVQTALQDAQRALGLVRQQVPQWNVDPHRVGVTGFSAGGHLVAALSTHFAQRS